MYRLIGSVRTRAVRVAWMLEELGLDYEYVETPPRSEPVKQHYGAGKIPILLDGDAVLTDSVAIMSYLADKHGGLTFPAGTPERAIQDGHIHFINEEMDSLLWTASKHTFIFPEDKRLAGVKEAMAWEYETSMKRLEDRLGDGPYLMGETLTVPDLLAAHCHRWAVNIDFPAPAPHVERYLKGLRDRDAFKRATSKQPME